jgi:predicted metal-dependent HD superfamily phosphohydrolase
MGALGVVTKEEVAAPGLVVAVQWGTRDTCRAAAVELALRAIAESRSDHAEKLRWLKAESQYARDDEARAAALTATGVFLQETLADLVVRVGQMIAFQKHNVKSPLNGEAAVWVEQNLSRLPVDPSDLYPPESGEPQR